MQNGVHVPCEPARFRYNGTGDESWDVGGDRGGKQTGTPMAGKTKVLGFELFNSMKNIVLLLFLVGVGFPAQAAIMDSGTGAPSSSVGNDGDLYHRTDVPSVYGPKASGAWPSTFSYIVGQGCTTVYHIDKDCDGYGVGPTTITGDPNPLFGPDADDSDATVNTPTSVFTKYGSINAFLTHMGYPTNRVFYIDPVNGVDASGCGTAASPCQHFSYGAIGTVLNDGNGGTVLYRASTSAGLQICTGGSCFYPHASSPSSPVVIMAYPGERVTFSSASAPLNLGGGSYNASTNVILSGFSLIASSPGAGYGVIGSWVQNITLQNSELAGWSMAVQFAAGSQNTTVTQNLFHDVSEHAVYPVTGDQSQGVYSSGLVNCSTWTWKTNNTGYNPHFNFNTTNNVMLFVGSGGYDAIHYNGEICGGLIGSNILIDGGGSAITLQDGDQNVTVQNNLIANNSASGITMNIYGCDNNGTASASGQIGVSCDSSSSVGVTYYPNMESGNRILNNTIWTGLNAPSSYFCKPSCGIGYYGVNITDTSEGVPGNRWIKNTIIQNNVLVTFSGNGGGVYPQLWFGRNSYPDTNTLASNLLWNAYPGNSSASVMQIGSNNLSCSAAPWYCGGSTTGTYGSGSTYAGFFSFSQFKSYNTGSNTNELWGDPNFADVQTTYSTTPNMFNFRLLPGSPAIGAGLASGAPTTDITGATRPSTPSIGAYEYTAATAATVLTSLSCSPSSVTAGTPVACTVTLSQAAIGGAVVALSSNSGAVTVPASVTVAAGASSGTFVATVGSGSVGQTAVIEAALNGSTQTVSLTFAATATVSAIVCSPSSIVAGGATTCNVTLTQVAGSGGINVNISSNMASLTVPATVMVPAGSATAQFAAAAGAVAGTQSATITAQCGTVTVTATVLVSSSASLGGTPIPTGSWTMVPTHGFPVQTVGYEKVVYAPAPVKKLVMLGNYHEMGSEPNTAMIAYDFQSNRWNVLDIGGLFHTENMPEAGHTVGALSYDPNLNTFVYYCCASGSNEPENPYFTWWYDPIGQTGRNKQTSPALGAVQYESSAFDSLNNAYVIHGGTSFEGTWTYNPTTNLYQQQKTLGTPPDPSLMQPAMTYDTFNHLVYLFGGQAASIFSNDLYSYDVAANTWTKLSPLGTRPAARWRAAFAYDSTNNVFMMYGGQDAANIYNDTWIYDPNANTWTQLNPPQSPSTPTSAAFERLAYDSDDNVFLLVAPGTGGYLDGTWTAYPVQTWMFRYHGSGPNPGTVFQAYSPTPNSINRNGDAWAKDPSLAASGNTLFSAWVETGNEFQTGTGTWFHVYAAQQSGGGWTPMGGLAASLDSEFSNYSESHAPSIAIVAGTPWTSWYKGNNSGNMPELYAKSWNGSSWVGGAVGTVGAKSFQGPSELADVAGVAHIAFLEVDKTYYPAKTFVYVKYWNGSGWMLKGTGPLNINVSGNTIAGSVSITSDGTNPYVAWTEYTVANAALQAETNPQVYVARWTGSQWVSVGGGLNVSSSAWADGAFIAFAGGRPYVAWTERSAAGNAQLFVKTFDGTNWVLAGSGPLNKDTNTGWAFHPSLAGDAVTGKLYLGWVEQQAIGQPSQSYVSVLNNGAWSSLGGSLNADPASSAQRISLAMAGGQPAAAWGEVKFGTLRQVFVKQWNGTAWTLAAGISSTPPPSPCDLNSYGKVDTLDVQVALNQALGLLSCGSADLLHVGQCNVIDVQRIVNAALGGACVTTP